MEHLTQEQIDALRDALAAERATLQSDLAQHGAKEADGIWDPNSSGLTGEEADQTDTADQIEELVTNVPIVHDLASRSHDIDDALAKIDEGKEKGTYGICEVGGEEIDYDRLVANPAARTCIAHAQ
jgi:RNA polymerase-binding transcription factor DksA